MDERALDRRVIALWRLHHLVRVAVLLPLLLGAAGAAMAVRATWAVAGAAALGLLVALELVGAAAWPVLAWRHFRYAVRERDLVVRSGVLFRRAVAVPLSRIQHLDTRQGPVERALGLARVLVFTASGMGADAVIPGLSEEDAAALRDEIVRRGGDDGV